MAETKEVEKDIEVYNTGETNHDTSAGKLRKNQSQVLPAAEAKRMMAYSYIVRADSISKTGAGNNAELAKENGALKAQVAELQGKLKDFLGASKMAELKELQEKHAAPADAEVAPQA